MAHPIVDEILGDNLPKQLLLQKHIDFLVGCTKQNDSMHDYMKVSGIFWTLTALELLGGLHNVNKDEIIEFIIFCKQSDGGFSPAPNHDSHLLSTLSAIQVLSLFDSLDKIDVDTVCKYISSLQQSDGSFAGDKWGEIDNRFSFCAIASLHLLGKLSEDFIKIEASASFLERCQNIDGGFGLKPGSESHAGQAYCVVGSMSILNQLHRLNIDRASWWLAERQLPSGGLNGRPEKKPDVCYSWWILASLAILGRTNWIKDDDLAHFIVASQDSQMGGIADRPGNFPDPFHTLFGIAGLSIIAQLNCAIQHDASPNTTNCQDDTMKCETNDPTMNILKCTKQCVKVINPVLCMPQFVLDRMQIKMQMFS